MNGILAILGFFGAPALVIISVIIASTFYSPFFFFVSYFSVPFWIFTWMCIFGKGGKR